MRRIHELRTIYPAHPVGGDVEGNTKLIRAIVRELHLMEGVQPICPYLGDVQALDDNLPKEREIGLLSIAEYFWREMIDEVWLFGPRISNGMRGEIEFAWDMGVPVYAKSSMTIPLLQEMEIKQKPNTKDLPDVITRLVARLQPIPLAQLVSRAARIGNTSENNMREIITTMLLQHKLECRIPGHLQLKKL